MKRNLIAIAVASMGLATAGAFAGGDRPYEAQSNTEPSSSLPGAQSPQPSAPRSAQYSQDTQIVKEVQSALSSEGYEPGPIDGQLNGQTQEALKQAQRDKGLEETGQIDPQTLAALGMGDLGRSSGSSAALPESTDSESDGGRNGSLPS